MATRYIDKLVFLATVWTILETTGAHTKDLEKAGWIVGLAVSSFVALTGTVTIIVSACLLCRRRRSSKNQKKPTLSSEHSKTVRENGATKRNYTGLSRTTTSCNGYENTQASLPTFTANGESAIPVTKQEPASLTAPTDDDYGGVILAENPDYKAFDDVPRPPESSRQDYHALLKKLASSVPVEDNYSGTYVLDNPDYHASNDLRLSNFPSLALNKRESGGEYAMVKKVPAATLIGKMDYTITSEYATSGCIIEDNARYNM